MVTRRLAAASLLLGLGLSCSREVVVQPTALFVVVDADPGVRMRAGVVQVVVRRVRAVGVTELSRNNFQVGGNAWPLTFVVRASDPSAALEIYAEAFPMPSMQGASPPVSVARALTTYEANSTRVIPLMLWGGCMPDSCMATQTCQRTITAMSATAGDCQSAIVMPTQVYDSSGTRYVDCAPTGYRVGNECRNFGPPPPDGGGMGDAATMDVPAVDAPASADAGSDAPADAGADAGVDAGFGLDVPAVDLGVDLGVIPNPLD
jgi:hypothetical protein